MTTSKDDLLRRYSLLMRYMDNQTDEEWNCLLRDLEPETARLTYGRIAKRRRPCRRGRGGRRGPVGLLERCLTLSTAHAPQHPDWGPLRAVAHEFGWVVFLPDSQASLDAAAWLGPALGLAFKEKCALINFDRDAPRVPRLPVFDW